MGAAQRVTRAAIYCRISQDSTGEGLGVDRQLVDCRALCAARGWEIAVEHIDNDVSAFSGKRRPAFEALLDAVSSGQVDTAVVWRTDRLARRGKDVQRFLDAAEAHKVGLTSCTEPEFTGSTGLLMLRIISGFAEHESSVKSERVARKSLQRAESGDWRPDGSRTFGFTQNGEPHPIEADLYREAADRVLAGETVSALATDWAGRGVMTATGKRWLVGNLRRMLQVPRHAGLVTYQGKILGAGNWQPLIDRHRWYALQTALRERAPRQERRIRKHLLTGLAVCELGHRMNGVTKRKHSQATDWFVEYRCQECGCTIRAEPLEENVEMRALRYMLDDYVYDVPDTDNLDEINDLKARLAQLGNDYYVEQVIDRDTFFASREPLERQIAALEALPVIERITTEEVLRQWRDGTVAWKRSRLDLLIDKIEVRRGHGPANERARIFWHEPSRDLDVVEVL